MGQARAAVAGSLHGRERQDAQHRLLRHPGGGRARCQRGHPQRGPRREAANEPRRRDGRAGGEVWPSQRARPLRRGRAGPGPRAFGDDFKILGCRLGQRRATVEGLLQGRERQVRTIGIYDTQEDAKAYNAAIRRAASKAAATENPVVDGQLVPKPPRKPPRSAAATSRPSTTKHVTSAASPR